MTKQEEILKIETELNVCLPLSYREFLSIKGNDIAFGLPVLGLPATLDIDSAFGATYLLRIARPELTNYLVIRIYDERVLCLDLTNNSQKEDAPLVEINLNTQDLPILVHDSFIGYIKESEESKKKIKDGFDRIKTLYENGLIKHYDRIDKNRIEPKSKKIPFKAKDWRVHRCCVHDLVVGLTAFRYNESFNGIEVDVFLTTDHPDYEEGHGVKALLSLILSDAYLNGTGMEVRFTKWDDSIEQIVPDSIPTNLLAIINSLGIKLQDSRGGKIYNDESINIFSSLLGIQNDVKEKIKELEKQNEATLQGICFLINKRIWTIEQINWLIINAKRTKAIVFGKDNPENRINYSESLSLGRSVLALTKLKEKIENSSDDETNEVEVTIKSSFYILTSYKSCEIDWLPNSKTLQINKNEKLSVLSRPRSKWIDLSKQILEDINSIKSEEGKKLLLYSNDILHYSDFDIRFLSLNKDRNLNYLIVPFSSEELDEEVIDKMKKARAYRA